jgi:hypothetical protein
LQRRAQELLRDCSEHVRRIGLTNELNQLPGLVRFIDDEGMRPGIETFAPDPAMRDIGLAALLRDPRMARDAPIDSGSRRQGRASQTKAARNTQVVPAVAISW